MDKHTGLQKSSLLCKSARDKYFIMGTQKNSSIWLVLLSMFLLASLSFYEALPLHSKEETKEVLMLGKWTEKDLDNLMQESSKIKDSGKRIEFLSKQFLGVPYKASTMIGDQNTPEAFVINLEGMDCFTYVDYVEALQLSNSFPEFKDELQEVRYRSGEIAFLNRNHFFTDWAIFNQDKVEDVTEKVGKGKTKIIEKFLNKKADGTMFLPGIPVTKRTVKYIPLGAIDAKVINRLRTGDYVGIYTPMEGLDVSHTGIIIKDKGKTYLRHASSKESNMKVVDEDLKAYMSGKPGLVVLRPK